MNSIRTPGEVGLEIIRISPKLPAPWPYVLGASAVVVIVIALVAALGPTLRYSACGLARRLCSTSRERDYCSAGGVAAFGRDWTKAERLARSAAGRALSVSGG